MAATFSFRNRLARALWKTAWLLLCRWTPRPCHAWRALVLTLGGAQLGKRCHVYSCASIWAPWNLKMEDDACIGDGVEVYNVALVSVGERAVVSQGAFLCTASHDHRHEDFPLTSAPITIGKKAWVAARVIVLPGVTIGDGAVAGAGSVVTKNVPVNCTVAGNPARLVREPEKTA